MKKKVDEEEEVGLEEEQGRIHGTRCAYLRLVCVLFTFENNAGPMDLRTDTTSYRDATAHLKEEA